MLRTHTCGELTKEHAGQSVKLAGWVDTIRDHGGGKFIDLRDRYGRTQVVISGNSNEDVKGIADSLKNEFVILVVGTVHERPEGQTNPKLSTGEIELHVTELEILNTSAVPPFLPSQQDLPSEDLPSTTGTKWRSTSSSANDGNDAASQSNHKGNARLL